MKKALTKRQALYIFIICFVANKAQRLPSLISSNMGRNGWLVILIMGLVDALLLSLLLLTNKINRGRNLYDLCTRAGGKFYAKFISTFLGLYFLLSAILPYEAVHDVFSNVLFDYLSWELYSFFLVFAIAFLACFGLTTIGRVSELLIWVIGIGFIALLTLGAIATNFSRVLPIYDISASKLFGTCFNFSMWFGDFVILYMFMGNVKEDDGKMNFWFIIALMVCDLLLTFGYVVFYGLYDTLSPEQTNFISSISQFSLLSLDIGRVDWFFVLLFEISTFISSAVYIYCAGKCFCDVLNIKKERVVCIVITLIVYVLDITVFKSVGRGASKLAYFAKYTYPVIVVAFPIMIFISALVAKHKDKLKLEKMGNFAKYSQLYSANSVKKANIGLKQMKRNKKLDNLFKNKPQNHALKEKSVCRK